MKTKLQMFYNKEQKQYFAIALLAVVVLASVTFFQPSHFGQLGTNTNEAKKIEAEAEKKSYAQLLESLKPDQEASQKLFKQLVNEGDVKRQIQTALETNQKIVSPTLPDSNFTVIAKTDTENIKTYITTTANLVLDYNDRVSATTKELFGLSITRGEIEKASRDNQVLLNQIVATPVPKEALAYQKSQVLVFQEFANILEIALAYESTNSSVNWPQVYRSYSIINQQILVANNSLEALTKKYQLANISLETKTADSNFLIKKADAAFGFGDTVFVVGNLPEAIWKAVREALARAFARFALQMLDQVVQKIESNFAIASQLYYSESLGQVYSTEYLNKYVGDPLDRELIKRLIPEFFCLPQNKEDLRQIYEAKAQEYLGYNPTTLDINDPDFYIKLAKSGTFLATPQGQELYYKGLASQTQSAAAGAASKEVISTGLKSPRDVVSNQINKTLASIFNVQAAAIDGTIQLGTQNVENLVGQLVAGVVENLLNKFVFSGAVLQEQAVCLSIPKSKPVIPITPTSYDYSAPSENPVDYPDQIPPSAPTSPRG